MPSPYGRYRTLYLDCETEAERNAWHMVIREHASRAAPFKDMPTQLSQSVRVARVASENPIGAHSGPVSAIPPSSSFVEPKSEQGRLLAHSIEARGGLGAKPTSSF